MAKPFILIGTPCYGGLVAQGYMESVIQLMIYAAAQGFEMTLAMNGHDSLITRSRNKLVATFLDMPQATHLMFIDADIVFRPEYVGRMLAFDQDVVAGMYPIKNIDWPLLKQRATAGMSEAQLAEAGLNFVGTPCVDAAREERDGFVTGTYAGTGFMLIKRAALKKMIAIYPETKYTLAHTYPKPKHQSDNQYALFECMIEPGSHAYLSEDFAFCRRWRDAGGKIWLDTQSRLTHIGVYRYEGAPRT
jgi:GT2 family glycosyltransferase